MTQMRLKQRGKAAEAVRGPQLVQTGGAGGGPGQGMRWACTLLLGVQILSSGLLNAFERLETGRCFLKLPLGRGEEDG